MAVKRYLKLYSIFARVALIKSMTYRVGFIVAILVDIGYSAVFVAFFAVMFQNIRQVAGWTYYEILFLSGLNIVVSEIVMGVVVIFNLHDLPEKIKNGDVDLALTKPVNSLFTLTLSSPYTTSIISSLPGFYLMYYASTHLAIKLSLVNLLGFVTILSCGFVICYSFMVIISSFSFKFVNMMSLPDIAQEIFFSKSNPHTVYQGALKVIFFYVFPVVFVASIPARTLLSGLDWNFLFLAIVLAVVFVILMFKVWNSMLKSYSSASS